MLSVSRIPKPRYAGRRPRTRRGPRRRERTRSVTNLRRAVEHMVTVTYATGRHPKGSLAPQEVSSKCVGLLISGSAGDAASARRRVAGNSTPSTRRLLDGVETRSPES